MWDLVKLSAPSESSTIPSPKSIHTATVELLPGTPCPLEPLKVTVRGATPNIGDALKEPLAWIVEGKGVAWLIEHCAPCIAFSLPTCGKLGFAWVKFTAAKAACSKDPMISSDIVKLKPSQPADDARRELSELSP